MCLDSSRMLVSYFIQQLFIELLLCAWHFPGTKETAVNKMNKVHALLGVTFPFGETDKHVTRQVALSARRTNTGGQGLCCHG